MSDAWPVVAKLNPGIAGLDAALYAFPKYDELAVSANASDLPEAGNLVEAALVVLNGGETAVMRFSEKYDNAVLDDRLQGPDYKITGKVGLGDRDVLAKLGLIAGSALAVRAFADHFSGLEFGKVNQAMASAFRELYRQYLERVAMLSAEEFPSLYPLFVAVEPFSVHLRNARQLIARLAAASRLARERKRIDGATDLVERASTSQFVSHDDREATIALRGGAVLRCLGELMRREMGDPVALNLYEELLQAASRPYLEMLMLWVTRGELLDPFEEFMIQETKASHILLRDRKSLDDYWDKRYTVRAMDLPLQLSSPRIYHMLLVSGKYLNVLREAEATNELAVRDPTAEPKKDSGSSPLQHAASLLEMCKTIEDPHVVEAVGVTYKYANTALLQLLRSDSSHQLGSLRRLLTKLNDVFFLQSDLYTNFVAEAEQYLRLPATQLSVNQLERALTQVKDSDDPWSEYISVSLAEASLPDTLLSIVTGEDHNKHSDAAVSSTPNAPADAPVVKPGKLTGTEVTQLDFEVPFPYSLVVSRRSIVRYQFLFRHLVELMTVRELLGKSYVSQPKPIPIQYQARPAPGQYQNGSAFLSEPRHWWTRTGALRQRQARLVDLLLSQSSHDGILLEYTQFEALLDQATEVSELVDAHLRFLDRSLMASLLSDPMLIRCQARLLSLCRQFVRFADQNSAVLQFFSDIREEPLMTSDGENLSREEALGWYAVSIEKHESAFDRNLKRFRERLIELVPTMYVAGGSLQLLLRQLEPLKLKPWPKYED